MQETVGAHTSFEPFESFAGAEANARASCATGIKPSRDSAAFLYRRICRTRERAPKQKWIYPAVITSRAFLHSCAKGRHLLPNLGWPYYGNDPAGDSVNPLLRTIASRYTKAPSARLTRFPAASYPGCKRQRHASFAKSPLRDGSVPFVDYRLPRP
jgi:hypothetical protein